MPRFPEDAEDISAVTGNERLFAVSATSGELIEVTPAEILASLKLKTVGGEDLRGVGNIPAGGGGGASGLIEPWSSDVPTDTNIARTKLIDGVQYLFTSLVDDNVSEPSIGGDSTALEAWTDTDEAYYPDQYNDFTTYPVGRFVWDYNTGAKGGFLAYKSRVANNIAHKPSDSPTQWERIGFYKVSYSSLQEYDATDFVADNDDTKIYISNVDNNTYDFNQLVTPWGKTGVKTDQPPFYNNTVQYSSGYVRILDTAVGNYVVYRFNFYGSFIGQNPLSDTAGVYWKRVGEYRGFYNPDTEYALNDVVVDPDDDLQMYISNIADNSFALDAPWPTEESTWQMIGSLPVDLSAVNTAIEGKADKVDGLLPVAQLPTIPENKLPDTAYNGNQFERVLVNNILTIQLKQSFIDSISGGTTPVDPDATPPVGSLNGRNYAFTQTTWPNDLERRANGGTPVAYVSGAPIAVGDAAVAANYHESRVKAVAGSHKASAWVGNPAIAAAGTDANLIATYAYQDFTVENAPDRPITQNPTHLFLTDEVYTDHPFYTGSGIAIGSILALKFGSIKTMYGAGEAGDGIYADLRVFFGFNNTGQVIYGTNQSGSTIAATQPTSGDFVLLTFVAGNSYTVTYLKPNGTTVQAATFTLTYSIFDTNPRVKGKMSDGATAMYPQGKNLTTWAAA